MYVGWQSVPGEVRLRRDRLSIVSHDRERTVGTIEQDYRFDDVAAVSLTTPSLSRPRRTLRLDMLDGSVEHVWVGESSDSFHQLDKAFRAYREEHPAPAGTAPASRSTNDWAARIGSGISARVALVTLALGLVGLTLFFTADTVALRVLGFLLAAVPNAIILLLARRS
ncbi:hypothetical protein GCM10028771_35450 [Nocardioides marmoraquaticus]